MRSFYKIVAGVCAGYLAALVTHELGYQHGVKDVLKANGIDSFSYKTKKGNEIIYHK